MRPLEQRGRAEACVWTCSVVRSLQVQLPRAAACIRHHLAPRRYRHPGRCMCDTPQTPWDVDFPCAPGTYACWAGTVRGRGLRNVGETFGCASSGTCPGRRALRSHASPATTPPRRPPAHPDRPTWSACMPCVDGDRREASRLPVSPEPALPAGAPEHIFVRCLCAEPSRASLERWQHAFGRWTPATSHLSGPAHASMPSRQLGRRKSTASHLQELSRPASCVCRHAQSSPQLPPHLPAQNRLLLGRPSVTGGGWCLHCTHLAPDSPLTR